MSREVPAAAVQQANRSWKTAIEDALRVVAYRLPWFESDQTETRPGSNIYDQESTYWADVQHGRLYEGQRVTLRRFFLSEWVPASPGLFATWQAERAREDALRALRPNERHEWEFAPEGKACMVDGGVSCQRLESVHRPDGHWHILGASSSGNFYAGLPVLLHDRIHEEIVHPLKSLGGLVVTLAGRVRTMADTTLGYPLRTPKLVLVVDENGFEDHGDVQPDRLSATASILFRTATDSTRPASGSIRNDYAWSYSTFAPGGNDAGLHLAVGWLSDYALRYSGLPSTRIVTDFDAQVEHFSTPAEIRLRRLLTGPVDLDLFDSISATTNIEITLGDRFSNNENTVIMNRAIMIGDVRNSTEFPGRSGVC